MELEVDFDTGCSGRPGLSVRSSGSGRQPSHLAPADKITAAAREADLIECADPDTPALFIALNKRLGFEIAITTEGD
ncbi:hypothetical protein IOD16_06800 [Saccharothrix sp. 6-C]|uniref:hypothetical protein n=1 Tax=Saccharothrix sp. 6-C TaxID=2781735 RepID=UPI0019173C21|nr:hypothetical protein [Saccharothrix sp. 6-C]QQQ78174.1 hypothetical protein IOD16_06800 [Saccharothrix sp. 6-C]